MRKTVCLATVLTPFHLKVLKRLVEDNRLGKPVHLIVPASFQLSAADQEAFKVHRTFDNNFRASGFWRNPVVISRQSRVDFKKLWKNVSAIFDLYADYQDLDLLIFNEKSALAQVAIYEKARCSATGSIIAADEGLAYYVEDGLLVGLRKLVYPLITRLLLGFSYQYFRRAGVHKLIDTVYMRYPELIDKKQKQYCEFRVSEQDHSFNPLSNKVLLLTSPFSEFGILPEAKEAKAINEVIGSLLKSGYEVVIKPHPIERPGKYTSLESEQLAIESGQTIIEEIDLEPFLYIVHFGSSAVIDILDRGFPQEHIITYLVTRMNVPFFEKIKIARNEAELAAILLAGSGHDIASRSHRKPNNDKCCRR